MNRDHAGQPVPLFPAPGSLEQMVMRAETVPADDGVLDEPSRSQLSAISRSTLSARPGPRGCPAAMARENRLRVRLVGAGLTSREVGWECDHEHFVTVATGGAAPSVIRYVPENTGMKPAWVCFMACS
ncbi:MAG: hypothetical protein OXF88_12125 [Rhodobacteraceae bacterium]|nr:hypothetical protein [Paracoccaceae bacterium]MCY4139621.1 hypothetical protein [Paracoccaceae bacterium]